MLLRRKNIIALLPVISFSSFFLFFSCNEIPVQVRKPVPATEVHDSLSVRLSDNAKIKDSTETVLIVQHDECTECRDFYSDSGIVYISGDVYKKINRQMNQSKTKYDSLSKKGPLKLPFRFDLNTHDFYFEQETDFYKLWPDTITFRGYDKKYRVKGEVVFDSIHRIKFRLKSFVLLDKKYAESFD